MTDIIGREKEKKILSQILKSKDAEFIAVYGRRRVGKTYLIENFLAPQCEVVFSVKGIKDSSLKEQLHHFKKELETVFYQDLPLPELDSWMGALESLANAIEATLKKRDLKNILIFFDELPWMAKPRSNLVQALDHFWNSRFSKIRNLKLVVCGSAASWVLDNLIQAKGGLHNRITKFFRLEPFTLAETREYLNFRGVKLGPKQVLELYMAVGGIPQYLRQLEPGLSAFQNIAKVCFDPQGYLRKEYERLFASLFSDSDSHIKIVEALGEHPQGLELNALSKLSGLSLGGRLMKYLRQLEEAGFIASLVPYGHKTKHKIYRLIDEYTLFYLKWIRNSPQGLFAKGAGGGKAAEQYWKSRFDSPAYSAWCGYAYESICLKNFDKIAQALEIENLITEVATWKYIPPKSSSTELGAQVDLLFDRSDGVVSLCEIKFSSETFVLDKKYAKELHSKMEIFKAKTKTKKTVFVELITSFGMKESLWSEGLISHVLTFENLF